ncbi:MAG: type II toxin-antitoxin system RelE/ParE family toxin [Tildeniella nuda ZEHNDER 1965/U140]|jgi:mRNA-degrading endonuclease RelE of RelBE toxin-antitoxin system|nr:type II toxin-antitoxin system RelE/ParE family toxin [Tildeniella nuda ZEHNDER 1965/U140]
MSSDPPTVQLRFTDDFLRQVRDLAKRYRQIQTDVQPVIQQLEAGNVPGDRIPGTGYTVFKVRIKNSDIQKGKSAGDRLLYQVESPANVLLLLIYSKSDQTDIAAAEIRAVIAAFYGEDDTRS